MAFADFNLKAERWCRKSDLLWEGHGIEIRMSRAKYLRAAGSQASAGTVFRAHCRGT